MPDLVVVALASESLDTRKKRDNDQALRNMLIKDVWTFGPDTNDPRFGCIRFFDNGRTGDYGHANEQLWIVRNNVLTFLTDSEVPTSHFILVFSDDRPMLAGKSVDDPQRRYRLEHIDPLARKDHSQSATMLQGSAAAAGSG